MHIDRKSLCNTSHIRPPSMCPREIFCLYSCPYSVDKTFSIHTTSISLLFSVNFCISLSPLPTAHCLEERGQHTVTRLGNRAPSSSSSEASDAPAGRRKALMRSSGRNQKPRRALKGRGEPRRTRASLNENHNCIVADAADAQCTHACMHAMMQQPLLPEE